MAEQARPERRKYPREVRKFLVKFRVVGGPGPRDVADRVGQVVNLSKGGVLLLSKRALPVGAILDLRLPPSQIGGPARSIGGMVRHVGVETREGDYPHGLMFVRIAQKVPPEKATAAPAAGGKGERRRFARSPQRLLLRLRCVTEGLFEEVEPRGGLLLNISQGGMEISTTRDYPPGCVLELHLPENPLGGAKILHGRVAWSGPGEKEGRFRLGLSLLKSPGN